jgi:hypothetical protein
MRKHIANEPRALVHTIKSRFSHGYIPYMPNCRVAFGHNPDGGCARLSGVTIALRTLLDQLGLSRYPKRGSDTQCRLLVSSRLQPWRGYEGFVAPLRGAVTWEIQAGTTAPIMLA